MFLSSEGRREGTKLVYLYFDSVPTGCQKEIRYFVSVSIGKFRQDGRVSSISSFAIKFNSQHIQRHTLILVSCIIMRRLSYPAR